MMSRFALPFLPMLITPAFAHEGLHHHPHGIEFGWIAAAFVVSVIGGGLVYAILRRRH